MIFTMPSPKMKKKLQGQIDNDAKLAINKISMKVRLDGESAKAKIILLHGLGDTEFSQL